MSSCESTVNAKGMWSDYDPKDAQTYPYKNVKKREPMNDDEDLVGRTLPKLIASLELFGKLILDEGVIQLNDRRLESLPVSLVTRLCGQVLEPDDISHLMISAGSSNPRVTTYDLTLLATSSPEEWKSKVPDLTKYTEVIFYKIISSVRSVVLRMSVDQKKNSSRVNVDGYFLGDVTCTEVEPYRIMVHHLISTFFPDTDEVRFKRRLHVPALFCSDNIFLTFLFVNHLRFHGAYLEFSNEYILRKKLNLQYTRELLLLHDNYLGQLDIVEIDQKSHPFITYDHQEDDDLEVLQDIGWYPIDVEGDGNCGYYVVLLGLENMGVKDFYKDTRKAPREKMSKNKVWADTLYDLRKATMEHSEHMLTNVYPKGQRDFAETMWWAAGVFNDEMVEGYVDEDGSRHRGLSECIFPGNFTAQQYVNFRFKKMTDYHMNVYWTPHVMASMFKMRVIVILRNENKRQGEESDDEDTAEAEPRKKKTYTWSIMSFEYKNVHHSPNAPHVEIVWKTDIDTDEKLQAARLSDIEFKTVPTIEMLYMHKPDGGHFQFLRRVLCTGIQATPSTDSTSLRDFIKDTTEFETWTLNPRVTTPSRRTARNSSNDEAEVPCNVDGTRNIGTVDLIPEDHGGTIDVNNVEEQPRGNSEVFMEVDNSDEVPDVNETATRMDVTDSDRGGTIDVNNVEEEPTGNSEVFMAVDNHDEVVQDVNANRTRMDVTDSDVVQNINEGPMESDENNDGPCKDGRTEAGDNAGSVQGGANQTRKNTKKAQKVTRTKRVYNELRKPATKSPRKNSRTAKARRIELSQLTKSFNAMCKTGEIPATRMMFESNTGRYYTYNVVKKTDGTKHVPIKRTEVAAGTLNQYNAKLVKCAMENPDRWMGPTIEDANINTGDAPLELCTREICMYQQHNNPYCIVYSLASALWYCNLRHAARWMHDAAPQFAEMTDSDQQIEHLLALVKNAVPWIGQATKYNVRTNRHDRQKRLMDWDTLFTKQTRYPTIVLPILPDGRRTHAFCVIDDLIFDSTTPCALKLCMDSVRWLFGECEPGLDEVYRFNHKCSPKNTKVKGRYKHKKKKNW